MPMGAPSDQMLPTEQVLLLGAYPWSTLIANETSSVTEATEDAVDSDKTEETSRTDECDGDICVGMTLPMVDSDNAQH